MFKVTNEERLKKVSLTKQKKFQESIKHVNLSELKQMYLVENKTYEYIREYYKLTGYTLDKILRENNIKKPKKQSASIVLETKYNKAGSKEQYDKQTYETTCANIIAKGKTVEQHYAQVGEKCSLSWKNKSPQEVSQFIEQLDKSYFSHPDKICRAKEERIKTNIERYGVDNTYKLAQYTSNSKPNQEFFVLLKDVIPDVQCEVFLPSTQGDHRGFRYDFRIANTLIELNPWPFHNSTWSPIKGQAPLRKDYHLDKTTTAREHNFRCLHVWDWDDKHKIITSVASSKTKIFARQCTIKLIEDHHVLDDFLNKYHFQNTCKGQEKSYGLYYQDKLVQVMTFGKPRYNKNYQWELLRLCSCFDYVVVGGANRLFDHFLKDLNPESIISYCDNSKFSGDVYSELGLSLLTLGSPTKHWYHPDLHKHITDNYLRQRGFDQLLGSTFGYYGKGTNNSELMLKHGFIEIYDCGQSTYVWKNNQNK